MMNPAALQLAAELGGTLLSGHWRRRDASRPGVSS